MYNLNIVKMGDVKNIGLFGRRNVGKSTLMNLLTGQNITIVSPTPGTTTDPVKKRVEIYGVGSCNIIDTPGIDDLGEVGNKRVEASKKVAKEVDMAILVIDSNVISAYEKDLLNLFDELKLPFIVVFNKIDIEDITEDTVGYFLSNYNIKPISLSSKILDSDRIDKVVQTILDEIVKILSRLNRTNIKSILDGIVKEGDTIILVCPIDSQAPTGRLILPQVMAIRDILDHKATAVVLQPEQLVSHFNYTKDAKTINGGRKIVITDSQAFEKVSKMVPKDVPLGSFSILMSRLKGDYQRYIEGVKKIDKLSDGDRVLILESCSHHSSCDDIGRVKLPKLMEKYSGKSLNFTFVSGLDIIPENNYSLVLQCGGCMMTNKQIENRLKPFIDSGIAITNYGISIAYMNGLFANENFNSFLKLL